jgi:phage shock protein A
MNASELKANLHNFIDQIENTHLLEEYYNEMKKLLKSSHSSIWDTLSENQKREVLLSFEESEDDSHLIDNDEVMKRYHKWL